MSDGAIPLERRDHRRTVNDVEAAFDRKLQEHELRERLHTISMVEQRIDELEKAAFPDGADAHRAAHQSMIDAAKKEAEFWDQLKVGLAQKSIWGILQILLLLAAAGLAAKLGLGSVVTALLGAGPK